MLRSLPNTGQGQMTQLDQIKSQITLQPIENAEDKDKAVMFYGMEIGTISRGWLRNGGDQWVYAGIVVAHAIGHKTIKDVIDDIARRLAKAGK